MSSNEELRKSLCSILSEGLLRIRAYGWSGNAEQCAVEADHLHNLPALIADPRLDLLSYYIDVSRPAFIKKALNAGVFESEWSRLATILEEWRCEKLSDTS